MKCSNCPRKYILCTWDCCFAHAVNISRMLKHATLNDHTIKFRQAKWRLARARPRCEHDARVGEPGTLEEGNTTHTQKKKQCQNVRAHRAHLSERLMTLSAPQIPSSAYTHLTAHVLSSEISAVHRTFILGTATHKTIAIVWPRKLAHFVSTAHRNCATNSEKITLTQRHWSAHIIYEQQKKNL